MTELGGRKIGVIDCLARGEDADVFEAWNLAEGCILYLFGEGGGETVHIDLDGVPAFRFDEELMAFAFGEAIDLIFYAWAVAGPYPFDAAGVHRAPVKPSLQDLMNGCIRIGDPAAFLPAGFWNIEIGETNYFFIPALLLHL